ncbi:MAG: hypothetical protein K2M31_04845 [Muribaculaceae bacterium]|nr:hypothetical protein [Muribaculaceae bacterium]
MRNQSFYSPIPSVKLIFAVIAIIFASPISALSVNDEMTLADSASLPDSMIKAKVSSTKIVYLDGRPSDKEILQSDKDSIYRVIRTFYYDQFRHFQDPDAPYFLFMSKEAGLSMGIGGSVRMRAYYDWNGAVPTPSFAPFTIPIPANPLNMRHFSTTPAGTGLFFRVIGYNKTLGSYQLYLETDFTGYMSRGLNLKKAYAMVRDFTVGYATSTFSDPAAQPVVIDAAGNNNKFTYTSVLVRYMPCFRKRWHIGVSLETPATAVDQSTSIARPRSEWLPDAAALVQYQWAAGQHVRLSGIVRSLSYRNMLTGENHDLAGWGINLSSVAHPAPWLTTYANFTTGKGIAGLGGDMQYGFYDLLVDPGNSSRLYSPMTIGWSAGLQYNIRHDLFVSLVASQTHLSTREGSPEDEYKNGTFACANAFWNILPRIAVAAELDYGRRVNVSGTHRNAWRANVMCSFSF